MSKSSMFREISYQPNDTTIPDHNISLFEPPSLETYISSYISYVFPCLFPGAIAEGTNDIEVVSSVKNEKKTDLIRIEEIEISAPAAPQEVVVRHPYSSPAMAMRYYQQGALQDMTTEQLIKLQHEAMEGHWFSWANSVDMNARDTDRIARLSR